MKVRTNKRNNCFDLACLVMFLALILIHAPESKAYATSTKACGSSIFFLVAFVDHQHAPIFLCTPSLHSRSANSCLLMWLQIHPHIVMLENAFLTPNTVRLALYRLPTIRTFHHPSRVRSRLYQFRRDCFWQTLNDLGPTLVSNVQKTYH